LENRLLAEIQGARLNGHQRKAAQQSSCQFFKCRKWLSFSELQGIAVSAGSACTTALLEISHVLKAIGLPEKMAHSSIRFSVGRFTTEEEIERAAEIVINAVKRLQNAPFKSVQNRRKRL